MGGDASGWQAADATLRGRAPLDLGYRSDLLQDVASGPIDDKLVVVRGPRRVGKSVLLKDTAATLCRRRDVDPRQVIYLPCDGTRALDLNRVQKIGRDLTQSIDPAPRVWLLDEVTGIKGWTETLKYLRDNTLLSGDTVVCTGSSWDPDAEAERDLFAGRAGTSAWDRDRLLLPMSFRDYLQAWGESLPLDPPAPVWDLQGDAALKVLSRLELFTEDLDLRWQAFLTSGGYPRAVAEYRRTGMVSDAFLHDLAAWLHRDIDPNAPDDSVPTLLEELQARSVSPMDLTDFANALGFARRETAELRVARLVRSFAAVECFQVDGHGRRIPRTQKKLYLVDPLLAWIPPRLRSGAANPDLTHLNEAAIGIGLARTINRLQPGRWRARDTVGYLRTTGLNEIDFAPVAVPSAHAPMLTTPLEAKWVAANWRQAAKTIEGRFGAGIMATRTVLDTTHPAWAVPAPMLSLLME